MGWLDRGGWVLAVGYGVRRELWAMYCFGAPGPQEGGDLGRLKGVVGPHEQLASFEDICILPGRGLM